MFDILNGIFLAATLLSNITLYTDQEYRFPADRETAVTVSLHREFWREDGNGKCKYTGLMVPYVRDWEEVQKHGEGLETILPPEPDKTVGHAFLVNKKICGDKVEPILRAGTETLIIRSLDRVQYKYSFPAYQVSDMEKPDQRPKWLEQVLRRVGRVAATDEKTKAFILDTQASLESLKLPADIEALLKGLGNEVQAVQAKTSQSLLSDAIK